MDKASVQKIIARTAAHEWTEVLRMLEIAASIFAFTLSLFLTFLFWKLAEESDNTELSALFGALTCVFLFCAVVTCLACIGFLLAIGGADNG